MPPVFQSAAPEVTQTCTINPELLEQARGASLLPQQPKILGQGDSLIGGLCSAVENIAHDCADAMARLQQAQPQGTDVEQQSVLDTSLRADQTHYTHAALDVNQPSPSAPAIGGMG